MPVLHCLNSPSISSQTRSITRFKPAWLHLSSSSSEELLRRRFLIPVQFQKRISTESLQLLLVSEQSPAHESKNTDMRVSIPTLHSNSWSHQIKQTTTPLTLLTFIPAGGIAGLQKMPEPDINYTVWLWTGCQNTDGEFKYILQPMGRNVTLMASEAELTSHLSVTLKFCSNSVKNSLSEIPPMYYFPLFPSSQWSDCSHCNESRSFTHLLPPLTAVCSSQNRKFPQKNSLSLLLWHRVCWGIYGSFYRSKYGLNFIIWHLWYILKYPKMFHPVGVKHCNGNMLFDFK